MMPRLGERYEIEIETIDKPKDDYMTDAYFELDLPVAPAVMVGDEILVEGTDVSEDKLEGAICRHLGIDGPPKKKSIFSQIGGEHPRRGKCVYYPFAGKIDVIVGVCLRRARLRSTPKSGAILVI